MANRIKVTQVINGIEVDLISLMLKNENTNPDEVIEHLAQISVKKEIGYFLNGEGQGVIFNTKQGPIKFSTI